MEKKTVPRWIAILLAIVLIGLAIGCIWLRKELTEAKKQNKTQKEIKNEISKEEIKNNTAKLTSEEKMLLEVRADQIARVYASVFFPESGQMTFTSTQEKFMLIGNIMVSEQKTNVFDKVNDLVIFNDAIVDEYAKNIFNIKNLSSASDYRQCHYTDENAYREDEKGIIASTRMTFGIPVVESERRIISTILSDSGITVKMHIAGSNPYTDSGKPESVAKDIAFLFEKQNVGLALTSIVY